MVHLSEVVDCCRSLIAQLEVAEKRIGKQATGNVSKQLQKLMLDVFQELQLIVGQLAHQVANRIDDPLNNLPSRVQDQAVSILGHCKRDAAALTSTCCDEPSSSSMGDFRQHDMDPEKVLQRVRDHSKRIRIILDILELSISPLLGTSKNEGAESQCYATAKSDILVSVAQMRGLFTSSVEETVDIVEGLTSPPTYDEATKIISGSELPNNRAPVSSNYPQDVELPIVGGKSTRTTSVERDLVENLEGSSGPKIRMSSHHTLTRNIGPKHIVTISPTLSNSQKEILRIVCFETGTDTKVAVSTASAIRTYHATTGKLIWELYGTSPSLVPTHKRAATFGACLKPSPDGSILCCQIEHENTTQLVVIEALTGQVKTKGKLTSDDGFITYTSFDNRFLAVFAWNPNRIKFLDISTDSRELASFCSIPFPPKAPNRGIMMAIAPDNQHIITCEGPILSPLTEDFTITVRVYSLIGGNIESMHSFPGSKNASSSNKSFQSGFHFPSKDQWLVSFPDYTNTSKTCIADAKSGVVLARIAPELSYLQQWQAGFFPTATVAPALVALDVASGMWTQMQVDTSFVPPGRSVTVTGFAIPGIGRAGKQAGRGPKPVSVVLRLEPEDVCHLSPDGLFMLVRRAVNGKVDIMSLEN